MKTLWLWAPPNPGTISAMVKWPMAVGVLVAALPRASICLGQLLLISHRRQSPVQGKGAELERQLSCRRRTLPCLGRSNRSSLPRMTSTFCAQDELHDIDAALQCAARRWSATNDTFRFRSLKRAAGKSNPSPGRMTVGCGTCDHGHDKSRTRAAVDRALRSKSRVQEVPLTCSSFGNIALNFASAPIVRWRRSADCRKLVAQKVLC